MVFRCTYQRLIDIYELSAARRLAGASGETGVEGLRREEGTWLIYNLMQPLCGLCKLAAGGDSGLGRDAAARRGTFVRSLRAAVRGGVRFNILFYLRSIERDSNDCFQSEALSAVA